MSANLLVDLFNTCQMVTSLPSTAVAADGGIAILSGGGISSLSGVLIGDIVDMINSDTYCNVFIAGKSLGSGPLIVQVQTSDATTSGSFTDPTSGIPVGSFPTSFNSGATLIIGSGPATDATLGIFSSGQSGSYALSGFFAGGAFIRNGRYARLNVLSGFMDCVPFMAGFISQLKTTGSGGGMSQSPSTSGPFTLNV